MAKAQIVVFEQLPVLIIRSKSEDGYLVQNATWTDKSKLRAAVGRPSAASSYGHPGRGRDGAHAQRRGRGEGVLLGVEQPLKRRVPKNSLALGPGRVRSVGLPGNWYW